MAGLCYIFSMNFKYIDIHSHLNLSPLNKDEARVLAKMKDESVATITVGVDYETSVQAVKLANENENFYACIGLHPVDSTSKVLEGQVDSTSKVPSEGEGQNDNITEVFDSQKYIELAKDPKVVAIGETGLDYFRDQSDESKKRQLKIFTKHIEIAIELNKPLMIHARASRGTMDAYEDTLNILEGLLSTRSTKLHVNFHFFAGNLEIANRIVKNGWSMSFDGPITFAHDYDEIIKSVPIENIMAETDAPFAAPVPYRGKTCEPWMVKEVYKQIAKIRGADAEEIRQKINQNAQRIFGIS